MGSSNEIISASKLKRRISRWCLQHSFLYRELVKTLELAPQGFEMLSSVSRQISSARTLESRLAILKQLLKEVEFYQPLYGINPHILDIDQRPKRPCRDRAEAILQSFDNNVNGMKILDVGSSLGYFSFFFSARGAKVTGLEMNPRNNEVATAVREINNLDCQFTLGNLNEDFIESLEPGQFDVVLILSVFHHIIANEGLIKAKLLLDKLLQKVSFVVMEVATGHEPVKAAWRDCLPDSYQELFPDKNKCKMEIIGFAQTHLSEVKRPLVKLSRMNSVRVGKINYPVLSVKIKAYPNSQLGTGKKYYISHAAVIKEYRWDSDPAHQRQIIQEVAAYQWLAGLEAKAPPCPCLGDLIDFEFTRDVARLVYRRRYGNLLSEVLKELSEETLVPILRDVLEALKMLRSVNLFHNDLRLWNILVGLDKKAVLIDLGHASPNETESFLDSLRWLIVCLCTRSNPAFSYPIPTFAKETFNDINSRFAPLLKHLLSLSPNQNSPEAIEEMQNILATAEPKGVAEKLLRTSYESPATKNHLGKATSAVKTKGRAVPSGKCAEGMT